MNVKGYMAKMEDARKRIELLPVVVDRVVSQNKQVLLDLNRDQMLLGTNTEGRPFTPNYISDPYFNEFRDPQQAAANYAAMKLSLQHKHNERIKYPLNYHKDRFIPNLIVTGPFQDSMFVTSSKGQFTIGSSYDNSGDIEQKYKHKVFGLAPLSVDYFWANFLRDPLKRHLKYF